MDLEILISKGPNKKLSHPKTITFNPHALTLSLFFNFHIKDIEML